MEAHFIILQAKGNPKKFSIKLGQSLVLGRSHEGTNIVVEDDLCSSIHCKISYEGKRLFIEDLNSKNGVLLNGRKVIKQEITLNTKFQIGQSTVYLNTKLMKNADTAATGMHKGYVGNQSGIELANKNDSSTDDSKTKTYISGRRQKYESTRKVPKTSFRVAVETSLTQIIDLAVSCIIFYTIIILVSNSQVELKDRFQNLDFFQFIFDKQMRFFSIASLALTVLLHGIIQKIPGGSLGSRILKLWK